MNKRQTRTKLYIIITVIAIASILILMLLVRNGININNNTKSVEQYNSLKKLISDTSLSLNLPECITEYDGELDIQNTMGQLISINSDSFAYRAAPWVDNNADPLGLYEECDTDSKYTVNNDTFTYFRYRVGYKEYPNCTIINWCNKSTSQGIMIGNVMTENEALELVGISKSSLTKIDELVSENGIEKDTSGEYTYSVANIGNIFELQLPDFKSDVDVIESEGTVSYYFNKKLIFMFIYSNDEVKRNTSDICTDYAIDENIVLRCLNSNPFESGTDAYNDYNQFIYTIDNIKFTFSYL